jgi:hypothetical protein
MELCNKSNIKVNTVTSLIAQIATILQGLFLPRLMLVYFGSGVNGLVSSISQFLNFFSIVEGGVIGVILVALYGPVANRDEINVSNYSKFDLVESFTYFKEYLMKEI